MAGITTKRLRRAAKAAGLQGRLLTGTPRVHRGKAWNYGPYLPQEPEGGAGVGEPRRPAPTAPADAVELEMPSELKHLDVRSSGPLS